MDFLVVEKHVSYIILIINRNNIHKVDLNAVKVYKTKHAPGKKLFLVNNKLLVFEILLLRF